MFALHAHPEAALRAGDLELRPLDLANGTAQFELTLYVFDTGEDLIAQVEYRTELWDAATIDRLLAAYQALLAGSLAEPGRPLADLPLPAWAPAPTSATPAEPAATGPSTLEADTARAAQLDTMRSQLTDEQRDLLRQRLRRRSGPV
jgi:non-ribosomal peptide synthetase component F